MNFIFFGLWWLQGRGPRSESPSNFVYQQRAIKRNLSLIFIRTLHRWCRCGRRLSFYLILRKMASTFCARRVRRFYPFFSSSCENYPKRLIPASFFFSDFFLYSLQKTAFEIVENFAIATFSFLFSFQSQHFSCFFFWNLVFPLAFCYSFRSDNDKTDYYLQ